MKFGPCVEKYSKCVTETAAGLFFGAERWMPGCRAFDLPPVHLRTMPRGEALLWGSEPSSLAGKGGWDTPRSLCVLRDSAYGTRWLVSQH